MLRKFQILKRYFSLQATELKKLPTMKAWSIHSYGDLNELQMREARIPVINCPNDVLIKVNAASVNPIDTYMIEGYGRTLFQVPRRFELEFPLSLGRDFSGTVLAKGHGVDNFNIGDEVYGFIPIHKQGSFAETVIAEKCHILPKPKALSNEECTSLVYSTMTAWSALYVMGNLCTKQTKGLRVLVLGGSGGVGTAAIQLLKSQGSVVFATCSSDAVPLVNSLGPDVVYNRNDPDFRKLVELEGKYHVILDACNMGLQNIPPGWNYDTYITLNSSLLRNSDQYGLVSGLAYSASELLSSNLSRISSGKTVRWGFFLPSNGGFEFINKLICQGKIKPIIQEVFKFEDLPCALQKVKEGHLRGKIVIKM